MQRSWNRAVPRPHLNFSSPTKIKDVGSTVNSVRQKTKTRAIVLHDSEEPIRLQEIKRDEQDNQVKIEAMSIVKRTEVIAEPN